jgi:hypothetical protein
MTASEALRIVQSLADGMCPFTNQRLPSDSPYQHADVVRALFVAVSALTRLEIRERRDKRLPDHAGMTWKGREDQKLFEEFDSGKSIPDLAVVHKRTQGSIQARLEKLGKLPPSPRRQF